jgi:UDP-glucose 4-epimerase
MTDIITGVAGFVGSTLAEELVARGREVVGIDSFHSYYSREIKEHNIDQVKETAERSEGSFRIVEGSITDEEDLQKLPENPENVYHNAAIAGVRNSVKNPAEYAKNNIYGTSKLIEYFDSIGQFVFASSSSVYGMVDEEELPVKEDRELNPIAPYPQSKKHCEEMIKLYSDLYDFDYSILRYFTAYGPRQRPDEVFTKFIKMVLDDKPVTIYGDGEQSRDFTYVEDIVQANLLAAEKGENETYNISTGRRITVNEMVETLDKVMDKEVEKEYVEQPEGDARHTHADNSKAKEELGFDSETDFKEGTKKCVGWAKSMHKKKIL